MKKPPPRRREFFLLIGAACALVLLVMAVLPGILSDGNSDPAMDEVATGKALVSDNCSTCHAIGLTGESPEPAAPPFRSFSQKWPVEHLEEALAEGIVVGHETIEMPEVAFEADEVGAVIAYLKSLEQ